MYTGRHPVTPAVWASSRRSVTPLPRNCSSSGSQTRDLLVEREAAAVDERQGDAGADERLGQRSEVEHRVRRHRPGRRDDARRPERLVEHHVAAVADEGHGPRHDAGVDRGLDGGADVVHVRSRLLGTAQTLSRTPA